MTALNKAVSLELLQAELAAAGVVVNGLGTVGDPPSQIHTYDQNGAAVDLPAGAAAVIAAHEPVTPPSEAAGLVEMAGTIDYGGNTAIEELSLILQAFAAVAQARGW